MIFKAGLCGLASLLMSSVAYAAERPTLTDAQLALTDIRAVAGKAGLYVIPGFDGGLHRQPPALDWTYPTRYQGHSLTRVE